MNRTVYYVNAGPEPVGIYTVVFARYALLTLPPGRLFPFYSRKILEIFLKGGVRRRSAVGRFREPPPYTCIMKTVTAPRAFRSGSVRPCLELRPLGPVRGVLPAENRAYLADVGYILAHGAANVNILGKISYKIVTWPEVPEIPRAPRGLGFGSFFLAEKILKM